MVVMKKIPQNLITAPPLRVKIEVWVLSVYTNLSVPSNYARDSGQERQDSLQHPVSHNNINVSLAEGRTVSWDQNDDDTEVPGFIVLTTKANTTILLQTISIPLMTKSGEVSY